MALGFGALWNAQQATTQQILDLHREGRPERGGWSCLVFDLPTGRYRAGDMRITP
jgi:hypothetical protein